MLSLVVGFVAFVALPSRGVAQNHRNHAQGFEPGKLHQFGGIENVNLFNGNLNLTIPIGPTYPVGGSFSYGLTLTYSGNVWEWEEKEVVVFNGVAYYLYAIPRPRSNAGLGWLLSLGRINPPQSSLTADGFNSVIYESPDGNLHRLGNSGVSHSQDGSYLRYNHSTRELESADGTIRTFDALGRPSLIRDRFGSSLTIAYPASQTYPGSGVTDWKLTDSHGRVHWVYFRPVSYDGATHHFGGQRIATVDRVVLTAFNGAPATYTFTYGGGTNQETTIARGWTNPIVINNGTVSSRVTVPLLTNVALPDGSSLRMDLADYDLGPAAPETASTSGHLRGMKLPTGGKYEWVWDQYVFPLPSARLPRNAQSPDAETHEFSPFRRSIGLIERRHETAAGADAGTWRYKPVYEGGGTLPPAHAKEHRTEVTDPVGHQSTHFFTVYMDDQDPVTPEPAGWFEAEYGLPFTRYQSDGTSPGRFLSSEIREKLQPSGFKLVRRRYVRYERDGVLSESNPGGASNPRVASERTVYVDDGSRFADVDRSDWDGLGHYRREATNGNFGAGDVRETFTNYNPGNCATCKPATSSPWVLGTYDSQTVREGTVAAGPRAKVELCFEPGTGFLQRTRTFANTGVGADPARSPTDVVTVFERYTTISGGNRPGDLKSESSYGGDLQGLGTGALCTLALPAPAYRVDHTHQYGTLRTSQSAGMPFKSTDQDVDFWTGMVKTSRDPSGLATTFVYDAAGRLTDVRPAQEGWISFSYNIASGATPAKVFVYQRPNGGGTPLATEEVHFDPFGRAAVERQKMANGTSSDRKTVYNALGWVTSQSEPGTSAATFYLLHDPFGRPTKIRPPDGAAHEIVLSYQGSRVVNRTVKVATCRNAGVTQETAATTTEVYDRQGRLLQVFEPANSDSSNSTTTYAYDVGGRLSRVTQVAKNSSTHTINEACGTTAPAGATATQIRSFSYDNRGFLLSETHPEKGASGNGSVTYSKYDARGHAGKIVDGPNVLLFTFDGAERLTKVEEPMGFGVNRLVKQFTYATGNGAGDWRLGKLEQAKRYNYPVIGSTPYTIEVTETYTYGGRQGRASKRDTLSLITANGSQLGTDSFTQSWTWNDLGNVASLTYPVCTHSSCGAKTARTVTSTYTNGWLSAVPGYASAITYHPNGEVNQIVRANNVTDTYGKDPFNLPRPASMQAVYQPPGGVAATRWSSGAYAYDGAGNVTKNGSSYYLYDRVSRVKSGRLDLSPGDGSVLANVPFGHTYDGFGNLQALTTATTRNNTTNVATNRLTSSEYDAAGNQVKWNFGPTYSYDKLNMMWRMLNGGEDWIYTYTADDERLMSYKVNTGLSRWTLRDLDGKVLREYQSSGGWSIQRDYVYRGSQLLAAHTASPSPNDLLQFHSDHLGTPRAITNRSGSRVAYHAYYPFGEEASITTQDTERMKLTGHERDLANPSSPADDLDYMHARFYNPQTGKFLSFDPIGGSGFAPQSWNAYSYGVSNPLKYTDPAGLAKCKTVPGVEEGSVTVEGACDFDSTEVVAQQKKRGGAGPWGAGALPVHYSRDISLSGGGMSVMGRVEEFLVEHTGMNRLDTPMSPGSDKTTGDFAVFQLSGLAAMRGLPAIVAGARISSIGAGLNRPVFEALGGHTVPRGLGVIVGLFARGVSGAPVAISRGGKWTVAEAVGVMAGRATGATGVNLVVRELLREEAAGGGGW